LSDLARRFIERRLFKAIDMEIDLRDEEFSASARALLTANGFDPDYYLVMDRAVDIPYYGYYAPDKIDKRSLIYIDTGLRQAGIREISEVSQVVRGMRGYRLDRVCVPEEVADGILNLIESLSGNSCLETTDKEA
jgi:uncharacterized protein